MTDEIRKGAVLIEEDELLPESLKRQSRSYSKVWRLVKDSDPKLLGDRIEQSGWTFFMTEGEVRKTWFGRSGDKTMRAALNRIINKLKWDKFNCLEITRVEERRFLGFSMVSITACWRLLGPSLTMTPEMSLPSARMLQRRQDFVFQESTWAA